jgi:hypothetical protein
MARFGPGAVGRSEYVRLNSDAVAVARGLILEKAFTAKDAKDAKDAKQNKDQNISCMGSTVA